MSRKAIQLDVLKQVVADARPLFTTRDVSEDERVRRAHPALAAHRNYHAFVGGALSDHHLALSIVEVRKSTPRGSEWQKQGSRALSAPETLTSAPNGPQRGAPAEAPRPAPHADADYPTPVVAKDQVISQPDDHAPIIRAGVQPAPVVHVTINNNNAALSPAAPASTTEGKNTLATILKYLVVPLLLAILNGLTTRYGCASRAPAADSPAEQER